MSDRIRSVAPGDLDLICEHRESLFLGLGHDAAGLKPMIDAFRDWLRPRLADKSYFGWIVEREGQAIAGLGMMMIDWPPHPSHPTQGKRGYVMNMYVEPDYWHNGVGRRLMDMARAEAEALDIEYLTLHATPRNLPIYEASGWTPTIELGLNLAQQRPGKK